jgi:hypothetical protein
VLLRPILRPYAASAVLTPLSREHGASNGLQVRRLSPPLSVRGFAALSRAGARVRIRDHR